MDGLDFFSAVWRFALEYKDVVRSFIPQLPQNVYTLARQVDFARLLLDFARHQQIIVDHFDRSCLFFLPDILPFQIAQEVRSQSGIQPQNEIRQLFQRAVFLNVLFPFPQIFHAFDRFHTGICLCFHFLAPCSCFCKCEVLYHKFFFCQSKNILYLSFYPCKTQIFYYIFSVVEEKDSEPGRFSRLARYIFW